MMEDSHSVYDKVLALYTSTSLYTSTHSELVEFWTLSILNTGKHNVSETGSFSASRLGDGDASSIGFRIYN
jgi:hypothetical protein